MHNDPYLLYAVCITDTLPYIYALAKRTPSRAVFSVALHDCRTFFVVRAVNVSLLKFCFMHWRPRLEETLPAVLLAGVLGLAACSGSGRGGSQNRSFSSRSRRHRRRKIRSYANAGPAGRALEVRSQRQKPGGAEDRLRDSGS